MNRTARIIKNMYFYFFNNNRTVLTGLTVAQTQIHAHETYRQLHTHTTTGI